MVVDTGIGTCKINNKSKLNDNLFKSKYEKQTWNSPGQISAVVSITNNKCTINQFYIFLW